VILRITAGDQRSASAGEEREIKKYEIGRIYPELLGFE
jgi:hypothetical protein